MADFIRPEARAALTRWRGVLVGLGIGALGLYWATQSFGFLAWIGWGLAALSLAVIYAGYQQARFQTGDQGPGIVSIDEGRIGYMGPFDGGLIDISDLTRLTLDPSTDPARWQLEGVGAQELRIPVNATGSDALFDLFARLPGIRTEKMLQALEQRPDSPVTLWQIAPKDVKRLH